MKENNKDYAVVIQYSINVEQATKALFKKNKDIYDCCIAQVKMEEAIKGYVAKRVNKPTSKGTKITFEAFKDSESFSKYASTLSAVFREITQKVNEQINERIAKLENDIEEYKEM